MARSRDDGPTAEPRREAGPVAPGARSRPTARAAYDLLLACLVVGVLSGADALSDSAFDVSLIYIFPVAWVAWRVSRGAAAAVGLLSAVADTLADLHLGRYALAPRTVVWNLSLQLVLLLSGVLIIDRLRRVIASEHAFTLRLKDAHERIEAEVRLIAQIQRSLLPRELPAAPGLSIAVHYATSTLAGGDYYDFFPLEDGRLGVLVADASGHGPAAAVLMAMTRAIVHHHREALAEPAPLLEAANREAATNLLLHHFVTACYLLVDPRTGRVEFATAGHPLPLLRRASDGRVEECGACDGPPLGIVEGARYRPQAATLAPGDAVLLYTDGLTEARHGGVELLGEEAVQTCLAECGHLPAQGIVDHLAARVRAHLHGEAPDDDVTILAIVAGPEPDTST